MNIALFSYTCVKYVMLLRQREVNELREALQHYTETVETLRQHTHILIVVVHTDAHSSTHRFHRLLGHKSHP